METRRRGPRVRSALFIPGNRADWMAKAKDTGADAVILDLEDAVPTDEKQRALETTAQFIRQGAELPVFVRVNALDEGQFLREAAPLVAAGVDGLMIPKVRTEVDILVADRVITWLEHENGDDTRKTFIIPGLETAYSILRAYEVACASDRVMYTGGIATPGGDVEEAIGYRWTSTGNETVTFRAQVLVGLRAAGVLNPLTGLWATVGDTKGLATFAHQSRSLGYEGMIAIHPSHISLINDAFTPTDAELQRYREIVAALEDAERSGRAAVQFEGALIDIASIRRAQSVLGQS